MNAIILMGEREMVDGQEDYYPMIEFLKEAGVEAIEVFYPAGFSMELFMARYPEITFTENLFFRNYNDLYPLTLAQVGSEDLYIITGDHFINYNIFYEFTHSTIITVDKKDGVLGDTYLIDEEDYIIDSKTTTQKGVQSLGIYYLKRGDIFSFMEELTSRSGLAGLEDPSLSIEKILYDIHEDIHLRSYTIPLSYVEVEKEG